MSFTDNSTSCSANKGLQVASKHALTHSLYSVTPATVHCTLCSTHLTTSATNSSQTQHNRRTFAAMILCKTRCETRNPSILHWHEDNTIGDRGSSTLGGMNFRKIWKLNQVRLARNYWVGVVTSGFQVREFVSRRLPRKIQLASESSLFGGI